MLMEAIKNDILQAMREKHDIKKSILRVLLGELNTLEGRNQKINDQIVHNTIQKLIVSNNESIQKLTDAGKDTAVLAEENAILKDYLPNYWSAEQIDEFFQSRVTVVEEIKTAKSEGMAIGIAVKVLKAALAPVNNADVRNFVLSTRT